MPAPDGLGKRSPERPPDAQRPGVFLLVLCHTSLFVLPWTVQCRLSWQAGSVITEYLRTHETQIFRVKQNYRDHGSMQGQQADTSWRTTLRGTLRHLLN